MSLDINFTVLHFRAIKLFINSQASNATHVIYMLHTSDNALVSVLTWHTHMFEVVSDIACTAGMCALQCVCSL